jgi:hypothetical protein
MPLPLTFPAEKNVPCPTYHSLAIKPGFSNLRMNPAHLMPTLCNHRAANPK